MKFNKQIAIILVLVSMLLSAIGIAVYFYQQNKSAQASKNQLVTIFVANKVIKVNQQIKEEDIKATTVARQYILTNPLLKEEILGKFAKETIYENEAFLKQKLKDKIEEVKKETKTLDYKYNSYNMALELFQNPNFSLAPDDIIRIISVYPNNKEKTTFKVRYVAKNIRVLGFLRDGYTSDKSIIKKKIKKLVNKKQVEEIIDIKADEIVLDIKEKVLLSLISDYNKGKQLWMVKSKIEEEVTIDDNKIKEKEKKRIESLFKEKKRKSTSKKKYKPRSYPVKWYSPKSKTTTKTATISYADNKKLGETKKAKITSGYSKECSQTDKLLIVVSNRTTLKNNASARAKSHKTVYKNYVLPYLEVSKINPNWYIICDGSYVNSADVSEITYEEYKKLK